MAGDHIEHLIDLAHDLFDEISVFEVMDLPTKKEASKVFVEFYDPVDMGKVDRYLDILDRLRREIGGPEARNTPSNERRKDL